MQAYVGGHDWLIVAYVDAYSESAVNMFALTSTWLTVLMAVCRYIVVCRPLHARGYISLRRTRCSIIAAFLASAVVNIPRLLRFTVTARHCLELDPVLMNFTGNCDCFFYTKVCQTTGVTWPCTSHLPSSRLYTYQYYYDCAL